MSVLSDSQTMMVPDRKETTTMVAIAVTAIVVVVVVVLWAAYIKVSGWMDHLDPWWSGHTPGPVPVVEHCGAAFCRY